MVHFFRAAVHLVCLFGAGVLSWRLGMGSIPIRSKHCGVETVRVSQGLKRG